MKQDLLPWRDRNGDLSGLKAAVFAALFIPAFWLLWLWWSNGLGPRRLDAAIHFSGLWAVRVLLLSLLITPARQLLRLPMLAQCRRMVGLAALAYALLHLVLYAFDQKLDLAQIASEIIKRVYLWIGFAALLGLVALGVTSTDGMLRRLGGRAWARLHRIVYALAVLALVHYALQTKADVTAAMLTAGLYLWLMFYRLAAPKGGAPGRLVTLALSPLSALATALMEAAWYGIGTGVNPWLVLQANLDIDFGFRPAVWVLLVTLLPFLLRLLPQRQRRRVPQPA